MPRIILSEKCTVAFLSLFLVVILILSLVSCEKDANVKQATKVWDEYVKAIRAGDSLSARQFLSLESQPYFNLSQRAERESNESVYSVSKVEFYTDYVKLHILDERASQERKLTRYLIKQDGKYVIQYPFLIFAKKWPVQTSPHFAIHSEKPNSKGIVDYNSSDTVAVNPAPFEKFYDKLHVLTGVETDTPIDFYLCDTPEMAGRLAGQDGRQWLSIGPCAISVKRYDFAEITRALTYNRRRPLEFLFEGLVAFGEFERCRLDGGPFGNVNIAIAGHFKKIKDHPILSLLKKPRPIDRRKDLLDQFSIAGALVDFLITNFGDGKFRELYQNSTTPEEFQAEIRKIYKADLDILEKELINKYKPYYDKVAPGKESPADSLIIDPFFRDMVASVFEK